MPGNDTAGSARTPLEMLRGVTRHIATAVQQVAAVETTVLLTGRSRMKRLGITKQRE